MDLAIESNPVDGVAYSNRGNILSELGRYEEAVVCYNKAITIDPLYAEPMVI